MIKILIITTLHIEYEMYLKFIGQRKIKSKTFNFINSHQGKHFQFNNLDIYLIQYNSQGLKEDLSTFSNAIININPKYIISSGVIAGISDKDIQIGDVIIPNQILDFSDLVHMPTKLTTPRRSKLTTLRRSA